MAPTIAVPTNADGLREILTERRHLRDLLSDPETFAQFMEDHVQARMKSDPAVLDQVKAQSDQFMIDWLREHQDEREIAATARRLNLDPTSRGPITASKIYNKKAAGGQFDNAFPDMSTFLHSISNHSQRDQALSNKLITLQNALSSVKPSDGGFIIPEILRAELLRTALESAVVRSRARIIPMDSLTVPFPTIDSTTNVSTIFGGITGYWTEEAASLQASQPRFGRVELRANKLTLYTEVPNELIRDALISLAPFLNDILPEAIAWFEDVACFIGSGVGEPLGFLNAPCRVDVTRAGGGNAVDWVDIVSMFSRLLPQSMGRAVWVVAPDTLPSLFQMTAAANSAPVMLGNAGGIVSGSVAPPMSMLGLPIVVSEKARAAGSAGDVNLCDFGYYLFGDRQAMSARQSEDYKFQNDLTCFRIIERIDGRPWLRSPITPQNSSANTLSPIVKLN